MAYASLAELRQYGDVSSVGDDLFLTALITRAQAAIDRYTSRRFEAATDTIRKFTYGIDILRRELYFDDDICQITTVTTDLDNGSGGIVIPSSAYVTMPKNSTPYYGIRLLLSQNYDFDYTHDPKNSTSIAGRWAYSITAPDDIKHACLRLSLYYYRQRDAQVFDVTAIPDAGIISVPQGIPADVRIILDPYVKGVQQ